MAFVVETGGGIANATSYASVADFKEYWEDRCVELPAAAARREIQGALVQATDFLDRRYRDKIIGIRLNVNQSLEFPRTSAFYQDGRAVIGVAAEWLQATFELAFRVLETQPLAANTLAPDPTYDDSNRVVTSKKEKVGPIEEETRFTASAAIINWRKFPTIEGLIRELVRTGRILQRA